jgi:hypothetical protein
MKKDNFENDSVNATNAIVATKVLTTRKKENEKIIK